MSDWIWNEEEIIPVRRLTRSGSPRRQKTFFASTGASSRIRSRNLNLPALYAYPTLHTVAVGTVRSLLGSGRHGQETLYLFQKHIPCCEWEYIVTMELLLFRLIFFFVLLEYPFIKNCTASKKLQSPAGYTKRTDVWSCVRCFLPCPACLFTPALERIKLTDEHSTFATRGQTGEGEHYEPRSIHSGGRCPPTAVHSP